MFGIYPGCTKHLVYNQSHSPLVSLTFGLPLTSLSWTREKTKYFEMDERKDFEMSGIISMDCVMRPFFSPGISSCPDEKHEVCLKGHVRSID